MKAATKRRIHNPSTALSYEELARIGPGTLAGRYMRLFWHPVYRAQDLAPGRAVPIRILGEEFTLYRGASGAPHVVAYRCAHRGTQLSVGWVEGDCIRCRYHGWRYDSSGQCVEQPAEDESFARKVRIPSYPTEEYLGLIFAYLGEGEAPPLPRYPEFEAQEGVREVLRPQVWHCSFLQRMENNGDTVHIPFTHRAAYSAVGVRAGLPIPSAQETEWGITSIAQFPGGATNVYQFGLPNVFYFRLPSPYPEAAWDERLHWDMPIDDDHSTEFCLRVLAVSGEVATALRRRRLQEGEREGLAVAELGEAILAGKLCVEDLERNPDLLALDLINVQDYVTQVGGGRIADPGAWRLGRSDMSPLAFRKIWERELRLLAEGRPLKRWSRPRGLLPRYELSGG